MLQQWVSKNMCLKSKGGCGNAEAQSWKRWSAKNATCLRNLSQKRNYATQKRNFSARFPSKLKLLKLPKKKICETSFKIAAVKLKNEAFLRDFLQNWSFEDQKPSISARLPSILKLWNLKTKLFCETSFKNATLKLQNEAFLRDFLQNWSFEDQKPSISARLPSKLKLWSLKTRLFCETSFKNATLKLQKEAFLRDFLQNWSFEAQKTKLFCETSLKNEPLKLQNEAFLRDFLEKWNVEAQKRSFSARLPSKMTCRRDTWPQNSNTF